MERGERHRVQSVLASRVGCRLGVSVAAHPSAATCSYNSLLLSLRSFNLRNVVPVSPRTKDGTLVKTVKPENRKKLSSSRDLISLKRRSEARSGRERTLQGYRDYFRIADHSSRTAPGISTLSTSSRLRCPQPNRELPGV
jgi:hypothetical protein